MGILPKSKFIQWTHLIAAMPHFLDRLCGPIRLPGPPHALKAKVADCPQGLSGFLRVEFHLSKMVVTLTVASLVGLEVRLRSLFPGRRTTLFVKVVSQLSGNPSRDALEGNSLFWHQ